MIHRQRLLRDNLPDLYLCVISLLLLILQFSHVARTLAVLFAAQCFTVVG